MLNFPRVIASSVIRSTHQGESHGGVYIIDIENETIRQVIDWNDSKIDWAGRGGDRGLRGIAFYNEQIYLAASNEIFVYDTQFNLIKSFSNPYLQHCHEIHIYNDSLFLTSTGYDSLLEYDLVSEKFVKGYSIRYGTLTNRHSKILRILYRLRIKPLLKIFDPNANSGPQPADTLHINSVFFQNDQLYFSGVNMGNLFAINANRLISYAKIPFKTHNARPFNNGVLVNDTDNNQILHLDTQRNAKATFSIKAYEQQALLMSHFPKDHARQAFARGLCTSNGLIIGGSSPATVSVYELGSGQLPIKTINVSMDVRNAIHGLEVWPY